MWEKKTRRQAHARGSYVSVERSPRRDGRLHLFPLSRPLSPFYAPPILEFEVTLGGRPPTSELVATIMSSHAYPEVKGKQQMSRLHN